MSEENAQTVEGEFFKKFVREHQDVCFGWFAFFVSLNILLFVIYFCWSRNETPILALEFVALISGMIGASIWTLRRIYTGYVSVRIDPVEYTITPSQRSDKIYAFLFLNIPGALGAFYALLFYIVISSGLISGEFFPKFDCSAKDQCDTFSGAFHNWTIVGPTSFNKLIFWCFMAGFIERFVPTMIGDMSRSKIA
ncbi:hypothetical protein [Chenggangzhangella methanolivorans]|uniref:Transmembrane protein n=1 Tax=Chenggangzhangella methanolivorans TaxID=1437009 RepID=A0A9E6UKS3_9HYPH|nr:hypothetical protein [Chenggangzhangella methanolivorans]QZN98230.1 hypothetical protein K6K41_13780 [Chenggangzhangella methanolivorans]